VCEGLAGVQWPARFEVLSRRPLFILDGGHNPQCAEALAESLEEYLPDSRICRADGKDTVEKKAVFLMGMLADKDYHAVIDIISPFAAGFVCLTPDSPRALPAEKLAAEVKRLKEQGIEAIPKLNFSACHDGWLKMYGRMLSTDKYRVVVKELIDDVCKVFGNPRYFHLGLDEEDADMQRRDPFVVIRRGGAWWKDFYHYLDCLSAHGARAMSLPQCLTQATVP
jgi:hypothetical protein